MDTTPIKDIADSLKGLELLFDYTKFHIGAYLTLTAAYITLATKTISGIQLDIQPVFAVCAVFSFMVAGLAGGIIISSITQCPCSTVSKFMELELGPWDWEWLTGKYWTYVEHTSFWVGLICAVLSFTKIPKKIADFFRRDS